MKISKERNIGLDLVRTVAIILVVTVHFFLNTNYYNVEYNNLSLRIQNVIRNFCMICVPLFIILTGYLNNKKEYDKKFFKSLLNIILIWLFYSILEYFIIGFYLNKEINFLDLIKSILKFRACSYSWYIEMFVGLYLLTPFLNNGYEKFTKRNKLIFILILIFCTFLPITIREVSLDLLSFPEKFVSLWPLTYFFIGKYIKESKIKIPFVYGVIFLILLQPLTYIYQRFGTIEYNNILTMFTSSLIFILIYNIKIKNKFITKIISSISLFSLDIYLASSLIDKIIYKKFNIWVSSNAITQSKVIMYAPFILLIIFLLSYLYGRIRKLVIRVR